MTILQTQLTRMHIISKLKHMNNKKKTLSMLLSKEELYVVLAYIKAKKLVGFGDERYADSIIETAEKGLIARGYLLPQPDGKLKLVAPLLASVGTCAFPEASILIHRDTLDGVAQDLYFHAYRLMLVLHTTPMTDIHQFVAVEDEKMILSAITSFLDYKRKEVKKYVPSVISIQDLLEIRDHAHQKDESVPFDLLVKKGFHKKTAQAFSNTLANPLTNTNISYVANSGQATDGFTILEGQDILWLIKPEDNNYEQVNVSTTSSDEIYTQVEKFVNRKHPA